VAVGLLDWTGLDWTDWTREIGLDGIQQLERGKDSTDFGTPCETKRKIGTSQDIVTVRRKLERINDKRQTTNDLKTRHSIYNVHPSIRSSIQLVQLSITPPPSFHLLQPIQPSLTSNTQTNTPLLSLSLPGPRPHRFPRWRHPSPRRVHGRHLALHRQERKGSRQGG
jgi:hypothetical protein